MCPSAPRICSEPGGQKPVLSLSLDRIDMKSHLYQNFIEFCFKRSDNELYIISMINITRCQIVWNKIQWNFDKDGISCKKIHLKMSFAKCWQFCSLPWRHNGHEGVSNNQSHHCFSTQPFIQAQIKENIKAPRHWPLCGEFTGDRWIPRTNGQSRGKCFHLMMSSCFIESWPIAWEEYPSLYVLHQSLWCMLPFMWFTAYCCCASYVPQELGRVKYTGCAPEWNAMCYVWCKIFFYMVTISV